MQAEMPDRRFDPRQKLCPGRIAGSCGSSSSSGAPVSGWTGHAANRILDCGLDEFGSRRERESVRRENQRDHAVHGAPEHLECDVSVELTEYADVDCRLDALFDRLGADAVRAAR